MISPCAPPRKYFWLRHHCQHYSRYFPPAADRDSPANPFFSFPFFNTRQGNVGARRASRQTAGEGRGGEEREGWERSWRVRKTGRVGRDAAAAAEVRLLRGKAQSGGTRGGGKCFDASFLFLLPPFPSLPPSLARSFLLRRSRT